MHAIFVSFRHFALSLCHPSVDCYSTAQFDSFSNGIDDAIQVAVTKIFAANRALSQTIATSAREHEAEFPFFSIPYFEVKAHAARAQASFDVVTYAPVVFGTQMDQYLTFANATRGWYDQSRVMYDELEPGMNRSAEPLASALPTELWTEDGNGTRLIDEGVVPIAIPSLHISPPPPLTDKVRQNIDLWRDVRYKTVTLASLTLKDAVFSEFGDFYSYEELTNDEDRRHPHSIAAQPIFKNRLRIETNKKGLQVVAYLYSIINWRKYLVNLLPHGVNGVMAVLRNSCDQKFTYRLDGNEATILGEGDIHDTKYDSWTKSIDFSSNYFDPQLTSTQQGHCQIFLDLYPTGDFVKDYNSSLPFIFSSIVAVLFIILALLFALYDKYVRARNRKVVGAAARTNAIVTSLFPSNVRERLFNEVYSDELTISKDPKADMMRQFGRSGNKGSDGIGLSKPLADFFPHTTVMVRLIHCECRAFMCSLHCRMAKESLHLL
jgi:hypothetical protein